MPGFGNAGAVGRLVAVSRVVSKQNGVSPAATRRTSMSSGRHFHNNNTIAPQDLEAGVAGTAHTHPATHSSSTDVPFVHTSHGLKTSVQAANGQLSSFQPPQLYPPASDHQSKQMSAYRRWMTRNNRVVPSEATKPSPAKRKVHSSKLDRINRSFHQPMSTAKYRETPGASAILYLGLGMIAVGLVITFVGIGDDTFHTLGLQLIGPVLVGLGFVVCGIRVLVCACADRCSLCDRLVVDDDGRTSPRPGSAASNRRLSWRMDDQRAVPGGRRLSSAMAATMGPGVPGSAALFRAPTPARIVRLEREEVVGTSRLTPAATFESSSSDDSFDHISFPSGIDELPSSLHNHRPSYADILSLQSADDIGSLNEFQEVELRRLSREEEEQLTKSSVPLPPDDDIQETEGGGGKLQPPQHLKDNDGEPSSSPAQLAQPENEGLRAGIQEGVVLNPSSLLENQRFRSADSKNQVFGSNDGSQFDSASSSDTKLKF